MKRPALFTKILSFALTALGGLGTAHALDITTFDLVSRVPGCLPDARGQVIVLHKEEKHGVDTLLLSASGLPANTEFTVFLTESDAFVSPPFGASEYIGDFTTNAAGRGSLKVDTIIGEAFASRVSGTPPARVRAELDHVVIWFADPSDNPACFPNITTPFDGDGVAGATVLSSQGPTGLETSP
jgi:hypothetical protein